MSLLSGKTAVITGASRGIGKAIALRFAAEGANIAITDIISVEDMEGTRQEIAAAGADVRTYQVDASDFAATEQVIKSIRQDFGRIDILVNNAGITRDTLLMRMSEQQWDDVLRINLKSAFNNIHAVAPIMVGQHGGSIINISSIVGLHGNAGQANYAASKAALIALAKSVAKELGPRGIRANCVAPGYIISDMTAKLPEEVRKAWADATPLRRGGTVDEVANTALFLASDLSSFITGQVMVCDGGYAL
ncbi:MAG: 3-oxoacyl-[acyl-carrier-protein] reductase [Bacteroidales bacterium]|nr:3-oxoacyl-[acyl-carrier-protein] reductase [Bacteroidales bacterium]